MVFSKKLLTVIIFSIATAGYGGGGGGGDSNEPIIDAEQPTSGDTISDGSSDESSEETVVVTDSNRTLAFVGDVTTALITEMQSSTHMVTASIDFIDNPTASTDNLVLRSGRLRLIDIELDQDSDRQNRELNAIRQQ